MDRQNAARLQVPEVQRESFASEQVQRDGIARECVHSQNVVVLRTLALHREACIAQHDFYFGFAIGNKSELSARDLDYQRVDIVKAVDVTRTPVSRDCAGAKSDHANTQAQP